MKQFQERGHFVRNPLARHSTANSDWQSLAEPQKNVGGNSFKDYSCRKHWHKLNELLFLTRCTGSVSHLHGNCSSFNAITATGHSAIRIHWHRTAFESSWNTSSFNSSNQDTLLIGHFVSPDFSKSLSLPPSLSLSLSLSPPIKPFDLYIIHASMYTYTPYWPYPPPPSPPHPHLSPPPPTSTQHWWCTSMHYYITNIWPTHADMNHQRL